VNVAPWWCINKKSSTVVALQYGKPQGMCMPHCNGSKGDLSGCDSPVVHQQRIQHGSGNAISPKKDMSNLTALPHDVAVDGTVGRRAFQVLWASEGMNVEDHSEEDDTS